MIVVSFFFLAWPEMAQAEHDPRAVACCVTTSEALWRALPQAVEEALAASKNPVAEAAVQQRLHQSIETTSKNSGVTMILALSYGAREEIVDGIRSLLHHVKEGHLDEAMITPDVLSKHLYTRYYPDPDLLIRTSGEMRISNFMLWQLAYTELWITDTLWPDFGEQSLCDAIVAYQQRSRRFGGRP